MGRFFIQDYTATELANAVRRHGGINIPINIADIPKYIENTMPSIGLIDGTITSITNNSPTIRDYCFFGCANLTYASFPQCSYVGKSAFRNTPVTELYLPKCSSYGQSAFNGCTQIAKLTIGVSNISIATSTIDLYTILSNNTNLQEVYLPSATKIYSSVFQACTNLRVLSAPNVTGMEQKALYGCKSLLELSLPALTYVGANTCQGCTSLSKVYLPQVSSLYANAFYGCTSLKEIYMPSLTSYSTAPFGTAGGVSTNGGIMVMESVTVGFSTVPALFSNQKNLIYFSDSQATAIGKDAFKGCSLLSEEGWHFGSLGLKTIGTGAFQACTSIRVIEDEHFIGSTTCAVKDLAFYDCTSLERVNTPAFTDINSRTFGGCTALTEVNLPNVSVITIAEQKTNTGPFTGCTALTTISMSALTSIPGYGFQSLTALTNLYIPNCTNIGQYAVHGCAALTNLYIPNCTNIGQYAINGCAALTKVSGPKVTTFGHYNLQGGIGTKELYLPVCSYFGKYALSNTVLESIYAPAWNSHDRAGVFHASHTTTLKYVNLGYAIIPGWFSNCINLRSFIAEKCTSLARSQFQGNISLYTVSLPLCTTVGSQAFQGCTALPSINLPVVTKISNSAFLNCTNFSIITLPKAALCALGTDVFSGTGITPTTGSIRVPSEWVASYKTATNWSTFADRIFAI